LVEKRISFFSEEFLFSVGSAKKENLLLPSGLLPGQKSIRLVKKGGDPLF
jgi:hypothetical protein